MNSESKMKAGNFDPGKEESQIEPIQSITPPRDHKVSSQSKHERNSGGPEMSKEGQKRVKNRHNNTATSGIIINNLSQGVQY